MDLAICHPVVVPARGGCERYIADLSRCLCADGHRVHLYASTWDTESLPEELIVHPVRDRAKPRLLRPWRFTRDCYRLTRQGQHDLTLGFDKVARVDVLYPLGGLHAATVEQGLLRLRSRFLRGVMRWTRYLEPAHLSFLAFERYQYLREPQPFIIAISEFVRQHFQEYLNIPAANIPVLHCATDPDRFAATDRPARRVATRQSWGVEPTATVALFLAMNYRLKGLAPLLRAFSLLRESPRFYLVVLGEPNTRSFVALADQLGIRDRVRFLGFSPDPSDAYFGADLLVHPTFYDPCSLVVLEAQACGLPVITSAHNGASELLHPPHDGLVIRDPHDAEEMAGALRFFLDPSRRHACARASFRAGQNWTFGHHYRRLLELLQEAAQRKRAA